MRKPPNAQVISPDKTAWDSPFPKFPGIKKKTSYQQEQEIIDKIVAMDVGGAPQGQSRTVKQNCNQSQVTGPLTSIKRLNQCDTQAHTQNSRTPPVPLNTTYDPRSSAPGSRPASRGLPPRPSTASGNRQPRQKYHMREPTMDSSPNSQIINRNRSFSDLNGQPYVHSDPKRLPPSSVEMPDFHLAPLQHHRRDASFEAHLQAPAQTQSTQREPNLTGRQANTYEHTQSFPAVHGNTVDYPSTEIGYYSGYNDGYEDEYKNSSYNHGYEAHLQNQVCNKLYSENVGLPHHPVRSTFSKHPYAGGGENPESSSPAHSFQNENSSQLSGDSLPSHPPPIRPGLVQNVAMAQPNNKPAPIRNYNGTSSINEALVKSSIDTGVVTKDLVTEIEFLRNTIRANPAEQISQLKLAKCLIDKVDILVTNIADQRSRNKTREKHVSEAIRLLKKLVAQQNIEAMFYLADCYGRGVSGVEVDHKEAFSLYQSAAKAGHAAAAYRTAVCCELGNEEGGGTRKDPSKAIQWYKRAATLGDTPAMYKMGIVLLKGLLGQPRNPREAIGWLKRAAERADTENPHALHELALLYEQPQGSENSVIRDEAYSFQLFKQAADLGYKFSQFRLGCAYEYGLFNCPIDPKQSILWYSRAAAQGEHQSELALSGWYLTGSEGVLQQNDIEAYLWARKAAIAGLAKAEYAMGYFTEVGIGSPANLDDAKRWYWRAAGTLSLPMTFAVRTNFTLIAQNFPKARERLEDLKRGGSKAVLRPREKISRSKVRNYP